MNPLSHILSNSEQRLFKDLLAALSLVLDLALDQKQEHSLRVAVGCVQLGAAAGLTSEALRDLFYAGLLHEIGEIGLMDDIDEIGELDQPLAGKDGIASLGNHPEVGARIVSMIPSLSQAAEFILNQHERFNGTGFPNRLKGEQIPLASQILAICNAVDSLAYGTGPLDETEGSANSTQVLRMLESWKGTRFAPGLTDSYANIIRRGTTWTFEGLSETKWKSLGLDVIDHSHFTSLEEAQYLEVTLKVFATIIDTKHRYTRGHSQRVAEFARLLALSMGLSEADQRQIFYAGFLHDAGKVAVPRQVLDKPAKLSDIEWKYISEHPRKSKLIVEKISSLEVEAMIAGCHHERFDGKGYPFGLKGEDIPIGSRIMAVVDSYDAMTSQRAYRSSLTHEAAVEEIIRCTGSMYDPAVAEAFAKIPAEQIEALAAG